MRKSSKHSKMPPKTSSPKNKAQYLSTREHVRKRANVYIGGGYTAIDRSVWLWEQDSFPNFAYRNTFTAPGIEHLFKEVLNNATDNVGRTRLHNKEYPQDQHNIGNIVVELSGKEITVKNFGVPIPVEKMTYTTEHEPDRLIEAYTARVLFSVMNSGTNFDDEERGNTAGVNGMGVKIVNHMSAFMRVETVDSKRRKLVLTWDNNGTITEKFTAKVAASVAPYTSVTFMPDLHLFDVAGDEIPQDTLKICRALAMAACNSADVQCSVRMNDDKAKIYPAVNFEKFVVQCFVGSRLTLSDSVRTTQTTGARAYAANVIVYNGKLGANVSLINSIWVPNNAQYNQILSGILAESGISGGIKDMEDFVTIFAQAEVDRPVWNSQDKTIYIRPDWKLQPPTAEEKKNLRKWEFYDHLTAATQAKEARKLAKDMKMGKRELLDIPDAIDANSINNPSYLGQRTLILCEGKSAKKYVTQWRPKWKDPNNSRITGETIFGVLPVTGKSNNIYKLTPAKIMEVLNPSAARPSSYSHIVRMMGLGTPSFDNYYANMETNNLRYSNVLIMADADVDGKHIISLIFAFFYRCYPQIVREGRLRFYRIPMIRVVKTPLTANARRQIAGSNSAPVVRSAAKAETLLFTAAHDFAKFDEIEKVSPSNVQYFKGLGTSDAKDIADDAAMYEYMAVTLTGGPEIQTALDDIFNESNANIRKDWLMNNYYTVADPHAANLAYFKRFITSIPPKTSMDFVEFINTELIQYSLISNSRAIPSIMDGFKSCQRKVFYTATIASPIPAGKLEKVVTLAAETTARTRYQHGDDPINSAILQMTMDYTGACIMPTIECVSAKAERDNGETSSPRYINVTTPAWLSQVFRKDDAEFIAERVEEEGVPVEFREFLPIIPMVIVNGTNGIGTGWSTDIPTFNPIDVIDWILHRLQGNQVQIHPWYRNYYGTIDVDPKNSARYLSYGRFFLDGKRRGERTDIIIHELPVGVFFDKYEAMMNSRYTATGDIQSIIRITDDTVPGGKAIFVLKGALRHKFTDHKSLHLIGSISTNNMTVVRYNPTLGHSVPYTYRDVHGLLNDFFDVRIQYYSIYRERKIADLEAEIIELDMKMLYIRLMVEDKVNIINEKEDTIIASYLLYGIPEEFTRKFLRLSQRTLTNEEINRLNNEIQERRKELDYFTSSTESSLWDDDLRNLRKYLRNMDKSLDVRNAWVDYNYEALYGKWPMSARDVLSR